MYIANVTNDFTIETTTEFAISSTVHPADDDDSVQYVFVPLVVFLLMLLLSAIVYCMSKYRRAFTNCNGKFAHNMINKPIDTEPNEYSSIRIIKTIEQNYNSLENETN